MKPYTVTVEVTTTYTVEVHAEDEAHVADRAWGFGFEDWADGELVGEVVSNVGDIEEIQREDEEDE